MLTSTKLYIKIIQKQRMLIPHKKQTHMTQRTGPCNCIVDLKIYKDIGNSSETSSNMPKYNLQSVDLKIYKDIGKSSETSSNMPKYNLQSVGKHNTSTRF